MSSDRTLSTKSGTLSNLTKNPIAYEVVFYRADSGREPVRDWLKQLDQASRKRIGKDLYTLQLGWPIGMPLARNIAKGMWELRSQIPNRIVRILFAVEKPRLILLHGFIKKSKKLPGTELAVARHRLAALGGRRKS